MVITPTPALTSSMYTPRNRNNPSTHLPALFLKRSSWQTLGSPPKMERERVEKKVGLSSTVTAWKGGREGGRGR